MLGLILGGAGSPPTSPGGSASPGLPWLAIDRPARACVAAWWLVMSLMTPLYHPYARLWLPLHAAGWVMLAGGVVTLGPFPGSAIPAADPSVLWRKKVLAQGAITLVCLVLAGGHWSERRPVPLTVGSFFVPTDDLRECVAILLNPPRFGGFVLNPSEISNLRVLGRRPLAFYLAIQGTIPFQLLADENGLMREPVGNGEFALVDEVQLADPGNRSWEWAEGHWRWSDSPLPLPSRFDPVTLLDIKPGVVFGPDASSSAWTSIRLMQSAQRHSHQLPPPP